MEMSKMWTTRRTWRRWVAGLAFLTLMLVPYEVRGQAGVSENDTTKASEEALLRTRAQAFWDLRLKDDRAATYEFFSPSAQKEMPRDQFLRMGAQSLQFVFFRIEGVEVEGDKGVVGLEVEYRVMHPFFLNRAPFKHFVKEQWVREDGAWYKGIDEQDRAFLRLFRPGGGAAPSGSGPVR